MNRNFKDLFNFSIVDDALSSKILRSDVMEDEGYYYIDVDVAGVKKEDIKISLKEGYLIVSIEKTNTIVENKKAIVRERIFGKFQRDYYVGEVILDKISASYVNGVLSLVVSKEKDEKNEKFITIS